MNTNPTHDDHINTLDRISESFQADLNALEASQPKPDLYALMARTVLACIVAEGDPEDGNSPAAWVEMHLDRDGIRHGYTVNDPKYGKTTFTLEFPTEPKP